MHLILLKSNYTLSIIRFPLSLVFFQLQKLCSFVEKVNKVKDKRFPYLKQPPLTMVLYGNVVIAFCIQLDLDSKCLLDPLLQSRIPSLFLSRKKVYSLQITFWKIQIPISFMCAKRLMKLQSFFD